MTVFFIKPPPIMSPYIGNDTLSKGISKAQFIHRLGNTPDYQSMNEELAMNFWGRVEQAQQLEGRSLKAICRDTGISYQTIMNEKTYARLPSLDIASKLANELHCSIDWLVFGSDRIISIDNEDHFVKHLMSDARKKSIVEKIANLNQSELFAIEVFLGIRK